MLYPPPVLLIKGYLDISKLAEEWVRVAQAFLNPVKSFSCLGSPGIKPFPPKSYPRKPWNKVRKSFPCLEKCFSCPNRRIITLKKLFSTQRCGLRTQRIVFLTLNHGFRTQRTGFITPEKLFLTQRNVFSTLRNHFSRLGNARTTVESAANHLNHSNQAGLTRISLIFTEGQSRVETADPR